jgi:competence protein ComEC
VELRREPLLLPAAAFAAGIIASRALTLDVSPLALGAGSLSLLWFASIGRANWLRSATSLSVLLTAGALAEAWRRPPPFPELDAADGEILLVSGCVVDPGSNDGVQSRFIVELEPGARLRVTLTAKPGEALPEIGYGRMIEFQARVRKPRNFQNPGAFDYAGYLARQSIYWTAAFRGVDGLRFLPAECGSRFNAALFASRRWLSSRVDAAFRGDGYAARLAPALVLGDNSRLEREWTDDFRRTGTYHALVVSGLHIAVVAGAALTMLRLLGIPLGPNLVLSAILAWAYAAVALWQPPVVRSAAGFTLFLIARWWFRRGRLLNLLAFTVLVTLAADPHALYDASFQLTFLSVAAIGAIAAPVVDRRLLPYSSALRRLGDSARDLHLEPRPAQFRIELRLLAETLRLGARIPARAAEIGFVLLLRVFFWGAEMVLLSAAVQLLLALALVLYFHQLSLVSIAANVFIVPALTFAVPAALLAAITGSSTLASAARWLIDWGRNAAEWWARIEPAWRVPDPPLWLLVVCTALLLLTMIRRRFAPAAVVGLAVVWWHPFPAAVETGSLELTAIDVGQGESLFVAFPNGQTMLVDGGGIPGFDPRIKPRLDIGEDVVSPYLWTRGINRIDVIAVTHMHDDHAGGIPRLIENFRPREVWTGVAVDSPLLRAIRRASVQVGVQVKEMRAGTVRRFGRAELHALAPPAGYTGGEAPANDDSLVLLAAYGRHKCLLTGDISARVEEALDGLPEIDVLKVAHHGGRASTAESFLSAARPLFALISAGADNLYGHPHPDVLGRLARSGASVFRTDRDGLTTVRTDGRRISVDRYAGAKKDSRLPLLGR